MAHIFLGIFSLQQSSGFLRLFILLHYYFCLFFSLKSVLVTFLIPMVTKCLMFLLASKDKNCHVKHVELFTPLFPMKMYATFIAVKLSSIALGNIKVTSRVRTFKHTFAA